MCNLYSVTHSQEAMRRLFRVNRDLLGNFPGLPAVFPDTMAPLVHAAPGGERELALMRWGFPPPSLGAVPIFIWVGRHADLAGKDEHF
jgi:putative SOS response-associated peptidase YedK